MVAALTTAELPAAVVNPAQVRYFAKALGQRAKSDPIDASVIAAFGAAVKPEPRHLPDDAARLLAELVGRRGQLVEMLTAERQRESRATNARVRKSLKRHIAVLEKEVATVEGDIDGLVRASPIWREKEDLLQTFPGVGTTIARGSGRPPRARSAARREIAAWLGSPASDSLASGRVTARSPAVAPAFVPPPWQR